LVYIFNDLKYFYLHLNTNSARIVMKKLTLVFVTLLLAGCIIRMGAFAPHRPDTDDHRSVTQNVQCLDCHKVDGLFKHKPDDNCQRCHRIVKGV